MFIDRSVAYHARFWVEHCIEPRCHALDARHNEMLEGRLHKVDRSFTGMQLCHHQPVSVFPFLVGRARVGSSLPDADLSASLMHLAALEQEVADKRMDRPPLIN